MAEEGISLVTIAGYLGLLFIIRWALFTAVIWGLLRMQSLNYTWPGLLLTTAIGSIAYFIPVGFIAAAAAFVIVYIGLKKVTQAEHSDLVFSIVINNAIMYVAGLWLLAAVLPDFHTLRVAAEAKAAKEEEETSMIPNYAGMLNKASNTFATAASRGEDSGTNQPVSKIAKAGSNQVAKVSNQAAAATGKATGLKLKGITMMNDGGLAMIQAGDKMETVGEKESITLREKSGVTRYVCESITTNQVVLLRQGSNPPERIELKLE